MNSEVYPTTVKQWTHIVDHIFSHNPKIIALRTTDHVFRTDDRNILRFGKFKNLELPIDSLPYNLDNKKDKAIVDSLLKYYWKYCHDPFNPIPVDDDDDSFDFDD